MCAYEEGSGPNANSPNPERWCPGLSELTRMKGKVRIIHVRWIWNAQRTLEKIAEGAVCENETRDMVCRMGCLGVWGNTMRFARARSG